ncbi:MAG: D-aminoacyl-tRNA deacylase [Eubacteriales bacterium]|nr:D-aminoacyl-tRNA deacylase [Eubacteriales bacterium]
MRAIVQRVSQASVTVEDEVVSSISRGFLILLGCCPADNEQICEKLWTKILKLRIFEDEDGKTNLSLNDTEGEVLIVSQFTLYADCKKGNRPSFTAAGSPDHANQLYRYFVDCARRDLGERVGTGSFGASMEVALINSGPFTIYLDSDTLF